jgi:ABC-type multidrug transport system fused ATPase/permease subunit
MRFEVFKKHGSQDDGGSVQGNEFRRCLRLLRKKWLLGVAIVFTMAAGGAPFLMNVVMGDMMNVMTESQGFLDAMIDLCFRMFYVILGMTAATVLSMIFRIWITPMFSLDLRCLVYNSIMELDMEFFDATQTGTLIGRLSEDLTLVRETYLEKFLQLVQQLTQSVVGIILALVTGWRVCIVVLPGIPLAAVAFVIGEVLVGKLWYRYNDESSASAAKAEEVVTQFRTIKAFDCEMYEAELYAKSLDGVQDIYKSTSYVHAAKDGFIQLITWAMIAGTMYYTIYIIVRKPQFGIQPGDMMILMMALMLGTMGVSQALGMIDDFKKAGISAAKLLELIEMKPEVSRHDGAHELQVRGKIEFRDVGFKYATRDSWAVRGLSFVVNPGETVALVGESGCGKSTTLQLLQRFYEINEGQILVDDVDIATLAPEFVRSQISIVPQSPVLFSMSVKENIRYAKPDADEAAVARAAQTGNAHDFICEMPANYDTRVEQTSLSGGQKQRICISRAILQGAPIMLLDEATAALDTQSEQLVQQSLDQVRHGKTAVVVAHRLATVMHADKIFVFKDGHVAETGTHDELVAQDGIYAGLVHFQLQ